MEDFDYRSILVYSGTIVHCTDPVSKTRYPRNLPPSRLGAFSSPFALSASYLEITNNLADLKDKAIFRLFWGLIGYLFGWVKLQKQFFYLKGKKTLNLDSILNLISYSVFQLWVI